MQWDILISAFGLWVLLPFTLSSLFTLSTPTTDETACVFNGRCLVGAARFFFLSSYALFLNVIHVYFLFA